MSTKKLTLLDADTANGNDKLRNEFGSWGTDGLSSPTYTKSLGNIDALEFSEETSIGTDSFYKTKVTVDISRLSGFGEADYELVGFLSTDALDTVFEDFATEIQVPCNNR